MVAVSIPDEVTKLFQFTLSFQPHYGPVVCSDSNRNEYQKQKNIFLRIKARPVSKVDKLTAICEPIV
jgi:hypothetical protein